MTAYLIDTEILLWAWHEPHRIPKRMVSILRQDPERFVSLASIWEIAIKASIGKLQTVPDPFQAALDTGCRIVGIERRHVEIIKTLPLHHRDPFDRMIIAQAQSEALTVLTVDGRFPNYDIMLA